MNNKRNIILIVIITITLVALITFATYAYFASNATISNVANLNATSESNNMLFDTIGGGMILNVTATNMTQAGAGNVAAENNTTLTVNFQANTEYSMVCSYDIVYEWTSTDKYQAHSSGVTGNEFTIQAALASNEHVSEGTNSIHNETDFTTAVGNQNSATIIQGAQIDSTGTTTNTAVWTLTGKIYNAEARQTEISGKTFMGNFKVTNVSCVAGTASGTSSSGPTSYWFDRDVCIPSNPCTFPNYGGTLQTSGSATEHNVYIGQDSSKNYVCVNDGNGHEACLSQSYTQYGLSGHTLGNYFTSDEQESAKQALNQVLSEAGFTGLYCGNSNDSAIICSNGARDCRISVNGDITCNDFTWEDGCAVDQLGSAYCKYVGS